MDFEKKNAMKAKYYKLFSQRVEATVVDCVLEGCNYDEGVCFQQLSQMCGDKAPPLPTKRSSVRAVQHDPMADNHGIRSPPYNSQCHDERRQAECIQQVPFPSAPPMTMQHPGISPYPPPYMTRDPNLPVYVPKRLYPSLPAKADTPPLHTPGMGPPPVSPYHQPLVERPPQRVRPFQTVADEDSDDDDLENLGRALNLALRLEVLRRIVAAAGDEEPTNRKTQEAPIPQASAKKILPPEYKDEPPARLSMHGFPQHWPRNNRGATIIPVNGDLLKSIETVFMDSTGGTAFNAEIQSIEELCNFTVYEEFAFRKHCFEEQKKPLNECQLWYPAREKDVEDICYKGIDFKKDISTGPIGTGKYFFVHASSAHRGKTEKHLQKDTNAYMFLCNVTGGDKTKGSCDNDFVPINEKGVEYGSSVDNIDRPSLYIVHDKNNCYPRYLITYRMKTK